MKLRQSSKIKKTTSKKTFIEEKDKWLNLQNILDRGGQQTGETDFSYQILGVYSLPEFFTRLQQSGSVDTWTYNIKLCDAELTGGKYNPRELTKEELKELENKKKPPPKINKKDLAAVKAEEDRLAQEQKEKEEEEKKFQEKLDKMSPEEQYYYLKEMPTKEPWISFPEGATVASVKKIGEKFIQLEDDINAEKGSILELSFIPPPDDDPKKRPKPKGINPDEVKPIYAVAWIDFTQFHEVPGSTELTIRAQLLTKEAYEKRIDQLEEKIKKKIFNPNDEEIQKLVKENEEENLDYIEKAKTYVYLKIFMSQPVNPILPDIELPEPIDLIKKNKAAKPPITQEEIEKELLRQFKIAIAACAKVYDEALGESAKGNLISREKSSVSSGAKKDDNINDKFIEKFNTSGRADLLKEKLKKFIVRIVREKYGKKNESVKGVYKDKRDQFYSELYAYLTDSIKKSTNEFVELKKDELHENVITPFSQTKNEIMNFITKENKEPEDKRLLRLSKENELLGDYNKAVKYYKNYLLLNPTKEAWLNYANLAKLIEDIPEVEAALTNAISIDPENCDISLQMIYCGLLYVKGQTTNAINYLNLYLLKKGLNNTDHIFNAFLSFLYQEKFNSFTEKTPKTKNLDSLRKKHWEAAKVYKMKTIPPDELKPPVEEKPVVEEDPKNKKKGKDTSKDKKEETEQSIEELSKKGNPKLHPEYKQPVMNNKQIDSIWFDTVSLFNRYNFYDISDKLISNISEETKTSKDFKIELAKILLNRKNYEEVIKLCDEIVTEDKINYDAYMLKGKAFYRLNRNKECEDSIIKAIRFKPQEIKFDFEMLVLLGLIYIKENKFNEAKVIFQYMLMDNPEQSFAWRYLGYAETKLGEFKEAERALQKANLFDVENPLIWAYLSIFDLNIGKKNQALECFNELNKINYNDIEIMEQIADLFLGLEEYEIAINIYKKLITQEKSAGKCYLKIATIYNEKLDNKEEALKILKKGIDNVVDTEIHQEMDNLIQKIEKEQEDLFIGTKTEEKEEDKNNEMNLDLTANENNLVKSSNIEPESAEKIEENNGQENNGQENKEQENNEQENTKQENKEQENNKQENDENKEKEKN